MATPEPDHMTADSTGAPLLVWDCGSALYDSYELTAFKRQLDVAVLACGRSLSMPHLPAGTTPAAADAVVRQQRRGRGDRRLRSLLRRLFSKVIRRLRLSFKTAAGPARGARYRPGDDCSGGAGSPWSGALTSIPEEQSRSSSSSPEKGSSSSPVEPGGPSALRKSQSERFIGSKTASSMVQFEVVL